MKHLAIFPAATLFAVIALFLLNIVPQGQNKLRAAPQDYYNLYKNTPRVRSLKSTLELHAREDADAQYKTLSNFYSNVSLSGSSYFRREQSVFDLVKPSGFITKLFPNLQKIRRARVFFKKRALNHVSLNFSNAIAIPTWAMSLEFWSHGSGIRHSYRLVYEDASGRTRFLKFPVTQHKGWKRFSANIPLRTAPDRPFAYRHQQLKLKKLTILDDHARRDKSSWYHLHALAASRIHRNQDNLPEWWRYRDVFTFTQLTLPKIKTRFIGYQKKILRIQAMEQTTTNSNAPRQSFLHISAVPRPGFRRIVIRFRPLLKLKVCRRIVLLVRGSGGGERLHLLVRGIRKKYYAVYAGRLNFSGWRKIYIHIPPHIVETSHEFTKDKHMTVYDIMIEQPERDSPEAVAIGIAKLGVVEDTSRQRFQGLDLIDRW